MSDEDVVPVEMRAPEGARVMEIDWSDGTTTRHPHVVLRGFCPCAHCQGHQGPIQWAGDFEGASLDITSLEEVGSYAVRIAWGDGHATGIYTWRHLRALGPLGEGSLDDARAARFGR
ncbi:gamma-butyrobetaine hydroxylase-like domain-containing protein [Sandaracinus amylolyticus]|uniref:gamma-butyrobetaine hydroxylase-like domain-containing protein n=1 Tax=Sandaracinus amylolyticus TaxID=927083 RepID=UPI001F363EDA|nr:DUF971 domain-containing protein [Sandaracinus amylolyticus]UJR78810.1 DUF971 domain-containing protein [Sandaracinus amylolyticus]